MQAPATAPPPSTPLRNLTDHLDGAELRKALHPFRWAPVYLGALRITIVEMPRLFTIGLSIRPDEYHDLMRGLLTPGRFGGWVDARTRMVRFVRRLSFELGVGDHRENVERFIESVLNYLTKYVLHDTGEITVQRYGRVEAAENLTLSHNGHSCVFNPRIAVVTSAGAQLFTVVAPSRQHGNPNCQLVGYLLAVAQKHFSKKPYSSLCWPNLIRLADGFVVYFAQAWVTRAYITNVENGMVNEREEGFEVYISDAFDLSVITERARFVRALTGVYADAYELAGPLPLLDDLELE